jgi:hypothetical protein
MSLSYEERVEKVYGFDPEELVRYCKKEATSKGMWLLGLLSDVQEEIECGDTEAARKAINRIKYLLKACYLKSDAEGRLL